MNGFHPEELKDLIENSGVTFSQNRRSYLLDCPRCQKKKKLWILKDTGHFVCWYCKETEGFQGRAEYALSEVLGKTIEDLRNVLYEDGIPLGTELNVNLRSFEDDDLIDLPDSELVLYPIEWPPDIQPIDSRYATKGLNYLIGRGITLEIAQKYNIHYWPSKQRVMFPVEIDEILLGYQGRLIYDPTKDSGIPKILTNSGLKRERVLMFQDNLKDSPHAIICEGPVDAIKADLCGGNVATMGKAVSKSQLDIVRSYGIKKIYLALDPDAADEVARLAYDLGDLEIYLLLPPMGRKDLGECTFEEVYEAWQNAKPFTSGNLLIDVRFPNIFA